MSEPTDQGGGPNDVLAAIWEKLDRLDIAIRGNGRPGIQVRLDRLEATEGVRSKLLWSVAAAVAVMAVGTVWKMIVGVS